MILSGVKLFRWSLPFMFLLLVAMRRVAALGLGESCVNGRGERGKCSYIANCKPMVGLMNHRLTVEGYTFLMQSLCERVQPGHPIKLVCCADNGGLLPEPPNCGVQHPDPVSNDQTTKLNEFPWTAFLMAQFADGSYWFNCGGTLINKRYVLTAAHCVAGLPAGWRVQQVRLGDWNLASLYDCEDGLCNGEPIDVPIVLTIINKHYSLQDKNRYNDIALLRLAWEVEYTNSVRPICLPLKSSLRPLKDANMYWAGWAMTPQKMKTELRVPALKNCARIYKRNGISLKSSQICTSAVRSNDTCSRATGGALMQQQGCSWYMFGLRSIVNCGENGLPDIYTNVTQYVDWIQDNIATFL